MGLDHPLPEQAEKVALMAREIILSHYAGKGHDVPDYFHPHGHSYPTSEALTVDCPGSFRENEEHSAQEIIHAIQIAVHRLDNIFIADIYDVFHGVVSRVVALLKMVPLVENGGTIYRGDYGNTSVHKSGAEEGKKEYDRLAEELQGILKMRFTLLRGCFQATVTDRVEAMNDVARCLNQFDAVRVSLIRISKNTGLPNRFIPPVPKEQPSLDEDTFANAVHFERVQRQEEQQRLLQSFLPSKSEKYLLLSAPKGFREYEWPLFRFTFYENEVDTSKNDLEAMPWDSILRDEERAMTHIQYERKLLIWYYAYRHSLVTHPLHLPGDFEGIMRTLEGEITSLQEKLQQFNSPSS